jgi:peptidoglycan hydrolase-like protein with peptidoglycan-binding domain
MKINTTTVSRFGMTALFAAVISVSLTPAFAFVHVGRTLDFGQTNADVTSLQQFLAASPDVYPQGLITGYFGVLTRSAVMNFQAKYGIVSSGTAASTGYGRVGPSTLAKINSLMDGGVVVVNNGGPAVVMTYLPQVTATTATFNWSTTNEVALGRVYYSINPLQMNEGDINSNGFAVTSGQLGSYDGLARSAQSSQIVGLQPNTTYYYTIVATDLSGNVSLIGPNDTFRTTSQ